MNTPVENQPPGQPYQPAAVRLRNRRGVALILVVSFVVLLSALVVGFFSRVTTDLAGARSYAEGVSVRQLADSAVGVVMGQIRSATSVPNGCWGSQPGMIRVFGTGTQAGAQAFAFYKLYSSNNLIVSGGNLTQFDPTITTPSSATTEAPLGPGGWSQQPAFFTDLNEPVSVQDPNNPTNPAATINRFPIFDPSVARIQIPPISQNGPNQLGSGSTWVEGCEIISNGTTVVPGSELVDPKTNKLARAPMPVRWLYVLKDGTLTAPTPLASGGGGKTGLSATWNSTGIDGSATGVPTQDNPIVGRIAFWTDDDTCKININTAGGYVLSNPATLANPNYTQASPVVNESNPAFFAGSFWDTPRVQTTFDRGLSGAPGVYRPGLANSQPTRNEFQRYPGHPATTSLGLVFQYLLPASTGFNSEKLYTMTPRIMQATLNPQTNHYDNSKGGTQQLIQYGANVDPTVFGIIADQPAGKKTTYNPNATSSSGTPPPSWHLLGSVDELFYSSQNASVAAGSTRQTTWNALNLTQNSITAQLVDQSRFFLTPHSRSPELNLMGRPRVTVWPIPEASNEAALRNTYDSTTKTLGIRNPSDDLIRFCSTVGGYQDPTNNLQQQQATQDNTRPGEFIFSRKDPYSPTTDFNLLQNHNIFTYLQSVTSSSTGLIPGWGGSFQSKYGQAPGGRDQILAEIFDYIRTVNLKDTSRDQRIDIARNRTTVVVNGATTITPADPQADYLKRTARYAREGIVIPTRVTVNGKQVSGFGRFPTITEASIVFYHAGYVYQNRKSGVQDVEYNWNSIPKPGTDPQSNAWGKANKLTGKLMRAFLIFETFDAMAGYGPVTDLTMGTLTGPSGTAFPGKQRIIHEIAITNDFTVSTKNGAKQSLKMGAGQNNFWRSSGSTWGGRNFGGTEGFFHTLQDKISNIAAAQVYPWPAAALNTYQATANQAAYTTTPTNAYYPFQTPCLNKMDGIQLSEGFVADGVTPEQTFTFNGGTITLNIHYVDSQHPYNNSNSAATTVVQRFTLTWPGATLPAPITEREAATTGAGFRADLGGFNNNLAGFDTDQTNADFPSNTAYRWSEQGGLRMPYFLPLRIRWASQHSYSPWMGVNGTLMGSNGQQIANGKHYANRYLQILQPGDTIRSIVPGGSGAAAGSASDPRLIALQSAIGPTAFLPITPDYTNPAVQRSQTLRLAYGGFYFTPTNKTFFPSASPATPTTGSLVALPKGVIYGGNSGPDLPPNTTATRFGNAPADFDTGLGNFPDGAFTGKADEGNLARSWKDQYTNVWTYVEPYFGTWAYDAPGDTYFSPNRQIQSAVQFGSLLAPQYSNWNQNGWRTLAFSPNPAGNTASSPHPGLLSPPDHLWLDLFNMPVVEPYAISEPFSTDGKVNLNYPLVPFSYIKRTTALRAALQPLRITAIPVNFTKPSTALPGAQELRYKTTNSGNASAGNPNNDNPENLRYLVDRDQTLLGFDAFFALSKNNPSNGFFKSASMVCERYLYPLGRVLPGPTTVAFQQGETTIKNWWANNALTGDNVREKPYSDLYPRVTSKSNTYTVHFRVQTLRQRPYTGGTGGAATYYQTWDESRDQVLSEYRGSTTIERYLDPEDPRFQPNYAPPTPASPPAVNIYKDSLENAYRFRIIYNKRFSPW